MDELELNEPIQIVLQPGTQAKLRSMAPDGNGEAYLQQQLTSCLGYICEGQLRLIARNLTVTGKSWRTPAGGSILVLEDADPTMQQEVTVAYKEGAKLKANWVLQGGPSEAQSPGAVKLWVALGGDEAALGQREDAPATMPPQQAAVPPPAPASAPASDSQSFAASIPYEPAAPQEPPAVQPIFPTDAPMPIPAAPASSAEEPPILSQGEIDKLIASLRNEVSASTEAKRAETETETGAAPEEAQSGWLGGATGAAPAMDFTTMSNTQNTLGSGSETAAAQGNSLKTGVSLDEWTDPSIHAQAAGANSAPAQARQGTAASLVDLIKGQPYVVVAFDRREDFDRHLASLKGVILTGTFIAHWQRDSIEVRMGQALRVRLEALRSKYRNAAVALETSITRLRQYEQLLPNLQKYREQQGTLAQEAERIAQEMRTRRLKQITGNHTCRTIATKVFEIEVRRQSLIRRLAHKSYAFMRKAKPSVFARSTYRGARDKYLASQNVLEIEYSKMATEEKEILKRLEYQADWQALIRQRGKIARDQDEIGRFLKATELVSVSGQTGDTSSMNKWLETEWSVIKKREKLLRAWQGCLADEGSWAVRSKDEPIVILTDAPFLTQPLAGRGGYLVVVTPELDSAPRSTLEGSLGWVVTDPELNIADSGRGSGQLEDPFPLVLDALAAQFGLEINDAMSTLGLIEEPPSGAAGMQAENVGGVTS